MITGHEWDGIKELNTRVPIAIWVFLIGTVIFAIGYWLLMPAWPLGNTFTKGLLGADEKKIVIERVDAAAAARAPWTDRIMAMDYDQIRADPALMEFVRADGHRLFGDNCAACHGVNADGGKGYPNLTDTTWLWGGSAQDIAHTIAVGVNSPAAADTRVSQMLAFGKDGILDPAAVTDVANYVKSLSDPRWQAGKAPSIARGREVFATNCVACHGDQGRGNPQLGAPDLTDRDWLYGGDIGEIQATIHGGRQGEMPAWEHRLTPLDRKILTIFVLDKGAQP